MDSYDGNVEWELLKGTQDSLDAALQKVYESGKASLHRLPSAGDLDLVEREKDIRELLHPDLLQQVLAHHYLLNKT